MELTASHSALSAEYVKVAVTRRLNIACLGASFPKRLQRTATGVFEDSPVGDAVVLMSQIASRFGSREKGEGEALREGWADAIGTKVSG